MSSSLSSDTTDNKVILRHKDANQFDEFPPYCRGDLYAPGSSQEPYCCGQFTPDWCAQPNWPWKRNQNKECQQYALWYKSATPDFCLEYQVSECIIYLIFIYISMILMA